MTSQPVIVNPLDPLAILNSIQSGEHLELIAEVLRDVADKVRIRKEGTKGRVTVTYLVEKLKGDVTVGIEAKVDPKYPANDAHSGLFDSLSGELYRRDPRDDMLPAFREVDRQTGEIREPAPADLSVREGAKQ